MARLGRAQPFRPIIRGAVLSSAPNTMAAPLGTLTLTGLVPAITQGNTLTAVLGTLTLTGLVPTIAQGNTVTAPLGTLTLTQLLPTIGQGNTLSGVLGTITLTGLVPTIDQSGPVSITAPLGVLTLMGLVPTFDQAGRPTWGTFPNWWPNRRKKVEEEFAEKVAEAVDDLPAKTAQILREVSRELLHEKLQTARLRSVVQTRLADEKQRNTAAAKEAVAKIQAAKVFADQQAAEFERMEVERKKVRRKKTLHILRMLH